MFVQKNKSIRTNNFVSNREFLNQSNYIQNKKAIHLYHPSQQQNQQTNKSSSSSSSIHFPIKFRTYEQRNLLKRSQHLQRLPQIARQPKCIKTILEGDTTTPFINDYGNDEITNTSLEPVIEDTNEEDAQQLPQIVKTNNLVIEM